MLFVINVVLNFFLRLVVVIITGVFLYIVIGANYKHRQCVQLKSGLNIGYRAVFDSHGQFLKSKVVLKLPNGTPLIESDVLPLYVSPTTVYGAADFETGRFAWRNDTGLVRKKENADLYKKLVSEAGDVNPGIKGMVSKYTIFGEFKKRPEYANQWCRTQLIVW